MNIAEKIMHPFGQLAMFDLPTYSYSMEKRQEIYKKLEEDLAASIKAAVKGYKYPTKLLEAHKENSKWKLASCIQKAVRRGDEEMAVNAAHALWMIDEKYLLRRLMVIAIEDIGMANVLLMAKVFYAFSNGSTTIKLGRPQLYLYLASEMAKSQKCRLATEICCILDLGREAMEYADKPAEKLYHQALDVTGDMVERVSALWLLGGTKRFSSRTFKREASYDYFWKVLAELELPLLILYVIEMGGKKLTEPLFAALPYLWEELSHCKKVKVIEDNPPYEKIGSLIAPAYDVYTMEGKSSIAYFKKACSPLNEFISKYHVGAEWLKLIGAGIFIVEGGVLNNRIDYGLEKLYLTSHAVELSHFGLPADFHEEFLKIIQDNMEVLNKARKKILANPR